MARHRAAIAALSLALLVLPITASARPDAKQPAKPAPGAAKKLEWLAFDAAAARAAKQDKHLLVDIYTTWCTWCKVMDRETYGHPEVAQYLTDNFVLAKVNGESASKVHYKGQEITERQFARAVGVTGYPATYFMKPNAELLGGVSGFIKHPDFLVYSKYVATRWYQKGKIKDYVDSLRSASK